MQATGIGINARSRTNGEDATALARDVWLLPYAFAELEGQQSTASGRTLWLLARRLGLQAGHVENETTTEYMPSYPATVESNIDSGKRDRLISDRGCVENPASAASAEIEPSPLFGDPAALLAPQLPELAEPPWISSAHGKCRKSSGRSP